MNSPLFIVLFADNDIYYGKKTYEDCGWIIMPDKPIKKIFFRLPTGDYIILADYSQYYYRIEVANIVAGVNAGKSRLEYFYILGKRNGRVIEYKIHILSGDTKVNLFDENNEYVQKLNPIGWKNSEKEN